MTSLRGVPKSKWVAESALRCKGFDFITRRHSVLYIRFPKQLLLVQTTRSSYGYISACIFGVVLSLSLVLYSWMTSCGGSFVLTLVSPKCMTSGEDSLASSLVSPSWMSCPWYLRRWSWILLLQFGCASLYNHISTSFLASSYFSVHFTYVSLFPSLSVSSSDDVSSFSSFSILARL